MEVNSGFNWPRRKKEAIDEIVRRAKKKWGIRIKKKDLENLKGPDLIKFIKYKLWGCIEGGWRDQFIEYLEDHQVPYEELESSPRQEPLLLPREEQPHTKLRTHCPSCRSKLSEPGNTLSCWCQK